MAYRKPRAGPSGSAVLGRVRRELKRGWKPGLTLLTGEDLYHLDVTQKALLAALVPEEASGFGLTVYGEQKVDLSTVVAAARSVGMFAPRRVVLVREMGALEGDPAGLVEYAASPPGASYLLIRAPKLDLRRKLHQALTRAGTTLEFPAPAATDPALADEVNTIARGKGLSLKPEAAGFLAEVCGGDFYRVDAELEKIRCWMDVAHADAVGLDVVREVAAGSGLLSGWEVADAVLRRDRSAALSDLRRLLESGTEPLRLLGGLAFRARALLQAKALVQSGMSAPRAANAARLWNAPPNVLDRYSLPELLRFPYLLLEADRTLKSRSLAPGAVLESLVEKLTAPTARTAPAR